MKSAVKTTEMESLHSNESVLISISITWALIFIKKKVGDKKYWSVFPVYLGVWMIQHVAP